MIVAPKFAREVAIFCNSELLTIVACKITVLMPWRVKLHAVEQLGRRQAVANFGNARALQTLMAKARTR